MAWSCLAGLTVAGAHGTAAETPPNIVLIISDDQAWTDYGFMGHPVIQTPHLDRLAREGVCYTRGYVPCSLCRCSLATIITGRYAHEHGITSNDPPPGVERHAMLGRIQAAETLPGLLRQRGYVSMQAGKWWEGNFTLGGFTHGMTHGDPARGGRHGDEGLAIGREGLEPIRRFLEETRGKPFFLWYAPMLPHQPHDPPERLLAQYRAEGRSEHEARYWAMCTWFDETCGALRTLLDEMGVSDNTLTIFIADNGWVQDKTQATFEGRSKRSPYEGGIRTPILLHWPGKIAPQRDETTPVISLDIAPTVLECCGMHRRQGMSDFNLAHDIGTMTSKRRRIFGEVFTHEAVDLDRPERSLLYRWCIEGWHKLILPQAKDVAPELYDLAEDPYERHDLAAKEPRRVSSLTRHINRWWTPGD